MQESTNVLRFVTPHSTRHVCLITSWVIVVLICGLPGKLQAKQLATQLTEPSDQTSLREVGQLNAHRETGSITLDGLLDDIDWQDAEVISDFIQFAPKEGMPASQQTTVRIIYGANSLYVGAVLFDEDPSAIEASLGRRDEYNRADWFLISIDSYFDKKTAYTFGVNAAGVQLDAILTSGRRGNGNDDGPGGDFSWDAIWYSSHRVTHEGWNVEMRIPYSMLRFSESPTQTWGIHFTRSIPRLGEQSEWPHVPRTDRTNLVARFGHLNGLDNVKPKRNIQVTPYTVSQLQRNEDPDQPGRVVGARAADLGIDMKIGIGSNVTFDATINPDFGQVESDPSVLNLTAFETVFQERRPFFLEGTQIFDFDVGPARLPYTRRIGTRAPIIGAAKLSGRTEKGLSFGFLGASTGEDFSPSRLYGVARVTQQIGSYSRTGGMFTAFDSPAPEGQGQLRSLFAGVDYDFRFGDNMFNVEGFVGTTSRWQTNGESGADNGYGAKVLFRKRRGALTGFFGAEGFDDLFSINDIGLLRQNNYLAIPLRMVYEINNGQPFGPFLRASVGDFGMQQFSLSDGLDLGQRHSFSADGTLLGFQSVGLNVRFENVFGGYDIYETRGLDPWAKPFIVSLGGEFGTDQRRSWQLVPMAIYSAVDNGGQTLGVGLEGNWRVGPRLAVSGIVEGMWEDDVLAWASNEEFALFSAGWFIAEEAGRADFTMENFIPLQDNELLDRVRPNTVVGNRHVIPVFGERDTRSVDLTLRSTITFTPKLSVQVYSQMFLARGRYTRFQLLQNRDTLAPFEVYPKRNEFTFSTLQSNVVFRWEYRPGSTLFFVWTHGRRTEDVLNPLAPWGNSPYERNVNGQISDTFDKIPTNVFLIKLSYTFLN